MWIALAAAHAAQVSVPAQQDTTIFAESGTLANGSGPAAHVGTNGLGDARRALLQFDLGGLPPGSTVTAVELQIEVDSAGGGAPPIDFTLHRLTAPWGEAGSSTGGGSGAPAQLGDATWTHALWDTAPWAPGGAYDPVGSATTTIAAVGPYSWTGPTLIADVQAWVDGSPNQGWLARADDEGTPQSAKRFVSREGAVNPPQLLVDFAPPPLMLSGPVPGIAGVENSVTVTDALPGGLVAVVYGLAGSAPVPGCPGVTVAIADPRIAGTATADAAFSAVISAPVPAGAAGRSGFLQAVQPDTCAVSAPVAHTF